MRKIFVIAVREYRAAVRTKAFIITMILMPVLMGGSIAVQALFRELDDQKDKVFAVVDRSGIGLDKVLEARVEIYNQHLIFDPTTKKQISPKFVLKIIPPSENTAEAIAQQRYQLSQQVEKDEIEGIVEIGPEVLQLRQGEDAIAQPEKVADQFAIRFQAKKPTQRGFMIFAERAINDGIQVARLQKEQIDPIKVRQLQQTVPVNYKALTKKTQDGKFEDAAKSAQLANFFLPGILIGLMFMVIMVGATPAMQGIVEEKGQRIAEVLLGSVTPFQLMAGKLLGVICVSLTMASVYFVGGYIVADQYDLAGMLSPSLIAWFVVFLTLALLIFGSVFIAIGAAAVDIKDTQTLMMPVMLIAVFPLLAVGAILQDPNGKIAVVCSFFPFATPMVLVARQSVPPGVPLGQMVAGIILVLVTTLFCVWAAGRIFRIGILMQGKGAKFSELIRWIFRG